MACARCTIASTAGSATSSSGAARSSGSGVDARALGDALGVAGGCDDLVAARDERADQVRRDEPRRAGDEHLHAAGLDVVDDARQAGVEVELRLPAEQLDHALVRAHAPEHRRVRRGPVLGLEVGAREPQEVADDLLDGGLAAAADVDLDAGEVGRHRAHVGLGDVADVHEVERGAAVAGDDRRLPAS